MAIKGGVLLKESLREDKVYEALREIDAYFKDKYSLSTKQVLEIFDEKEESIPLSAFSNSNLSALEIVTRYMKDSLRKSYSDIGRILNRNPRTIWCTYANSLKKNPLPLSASSGSVSIPLSAFSNRELSPLESIVLYLKERAGFTFNEIGKALLKDYQTVWTTYRRGIAK